MKEVLQQYLAVYTQYPPEVFLNKQERSRRHQLLMQWQRASFAETVSACELLHFIAEHPELKYERPFFQKVVAPCVEQDIREGKTDALRFLFEYGGRELAGTNRAPVFLFCEAVGFKYSEAELADMLLACEPEHEGALFYKYRLAEYFLDNSIHEVPCGVLYGMDGAEKKHLPSMWKELKEFQELSEKLGIPDGGLADQCAVYYRAWESYLDEPEAYNGFADYLEKQCIAF